MSAGPVSGSAATAPSSATRGTVPMAMEPNEITPEPARAARLAAQGGDASGIGMTIIAGIGRHGPWLKHGANYVPLPEDEDVLTVRLNRAVALVDTG